MIMNEKERVENLLEMGDFSENTFIEVQLVIRYFINELGLTIKEEIMKRIVSLLEDKLPNFYEWEWEDTLESLIKQELKNKTPITSISAIYITEEEINIIRSLKKPQQRKLLATLIIYVRYASLKKGVKVEWTNKTLKSQEAILKSANINNLTFKNQHLVVKDLLDLGLLTQSKMLTSLSLKVNCLNDSGNIAIWVNSFENLGNLIEDYINITYNGYKVCEVCGKTYKPKAKDYSSKYCNNCKKEVIKAKDRERKSKNK